MTLIAMVIVDILFLRYAYISFFCLLAGMVTLHLIYIKRAINAAVTARYCSAEAVIFIMRFAH